MVRRPSLSTFFRLSGRHQRLALEAAWNLLRARIDTLKPASSYTRHLGEMGRESPMLTEEQEFAATEIGAVVERVSRIMPFRAQCLQQALATQRMLRRRGLGATVFLGLATDRAARAAGTADDPAHAWVQAGKVVVNGQQNLDKFAVVGRFS